MRCFDNNYLITQIKKTELENEMKFKNLIKCEQENEYKKFIGYSINPYENVSLILYYNN